MPLSPADFYAYSRATGAPVADTPEDRAKQAPEVLAFQQNRLQAPKQGPGLLDILGGAALLAGVGAGGYGIARAMRNRSLGQAAAQVAAEEITPLAVQNVRRAAAAPVMDPWGQGNIPQPPSSRYIPSAPWNIEAAVKPSTINLSQQTTTLVEQQAAQRALHTDQAVNALGAAEDQMTGRMKHALQQNPHLDLSQVETLEDMAEYSYRQGMEQDEPINVAAAQIIGHVPNDQAETPQASAQNFLQSRRAELAAQGLGPGRIERELLKGPEGTRIKQGTELYAATGTPSTLNLLSNTPSLPLTVQPKTLVAAGSQSLETDVPTGVLYKPFAPRDPNVGSLIHADIYHTNAISNAGDKLAGTPTHIENPEYTSLVEQTNMAQHAMSQGDDMAAVIFNRNRAAFRNGQAPERLIVNPEHIDLQNDIAYHTQAREDVRNRQAVKELDVQRFPNLMAVQQMQEGTRAFAEIDPSTGGIKPETLELRPGRSSVPPGTVTQTAAGTAIRGRIGAVETESELNPESLRYSNEIVGGTYRPTDSFEGQTYTATPVIWDPSIHTKQQRTPEGLVYTQEAMQRPTAGQNKGYGTRPATSPEVAKQSINLSEQVRKSKDPQAFLAKIMEEKGISAIGPSSPLRYK